MGRYHKTFSLLLATSINKRAARAIALAAGHSEVHSTPHDCLVGYDAMKYVMALDITGDRAIKMLGAATRNGARSVRVIRIIDAQWGRGLSAPFCGKRIDMGHGTGLRITKKQWADSIVTATA